MKRKPVSTFLALQSLHWPAPVVPETFLDNRRSALWASIVYWAIQVGRGLHQIPRHLVIDDCIHVFTSFFRLVKIRTSACPATTRPCNLVGHVMLLRFHRVERGR